MITRKLFKSWKLVALLTLGALQACSTVSEAPQPPTPKLQVTSLPAEILQIDTSSSQTWLQEAQAWLADLLSWSSSEMPK